MYKARNILNKKCLTQIYFSFIHSYINYANIAWGSTHKSKLIPILRQQKHASRIILFKTKETHARPLMKDLNILDIFQTNILQNLVFMYKVKNNTIPNIFQNRFMLNNKHKYTTRSSAENYKKPKKNSKFSQFSISFLLGTVLEADRFLKHIKYSTNVYRGYDDSFTHCFYALITCIQCMYNIV